MGNPEDSKPLDLTKVLSGVGDPESMVGRQKNLKSDGNPEMIIGISVQNMGTHMRGGISTSKGMRD